ncbi:MAG: cell division protein FtsZ, partial [Aeromicrobium sp.]
ITTPGLINLDFADVKSVMSDAGSALMGIGSARGEHRAAVAAESAVSSPLLEASIEGARGVLLSIAGGSDLGLFEINEAAGLVADAVHPDANIIFGAVIDDALGDEVRVTVIAAGFDGGEPMLRDATKPALLKENPSPADPPPAAPPAAAAPPRTAESYLPPDPYLDGGRPTTLPPRDGAGNEALPPEPMPADYGDDLDVPDFLR